MYLSKKMETIRALALREWMVYRNTHFLYKVKVSQAVNKWVDPRKSVVKEMLKSVWTKSTINAWEEITTIYNQSVEDINEEVTTVDGTYKEWVLIKADTRSRIYTVLLNEVPVIVKTYLTVNRNAYARDENTISQKLFDKGFYVPKRYTSFNTTHFLCIPMEKLSYTLGDVYVKEPNEGIALDTIKQMVKNTVPILQTLHTTEHMCYVDFSCGNVAFMDGMPYLIDFGALHSYTLGFTPSMSTPRYASINASNSKAITPLDDLESFGYVVLEALYGPLNENCPLLDEHKVISVNAKNGKYGAFAQAYFLALKDKDPYNALLQL